MRKTGVFLIVVGLLFLMASATLLIYNRNEDRQAGELAERQLSLLIEQIEEGKRGETDTEPSPEEEEALEQELQALPSEPVAEEIRMEELRVDGNGYVGYLSFPTLELYLPVMSDWSVHKLHTAPCHYYGTVSQGNMVIMAHNYQHHFGRLPELRSGDPVYFVNIFGETFFYEVALQEILPSDCIPQLTEGKYDLTLFTCTYGGANRITVRCNESAPPQ